MEPQVCPASLNFPARASPCLPSSLSPFPPPSLSSSFAPFYFPLLPQLPLESSGFPCAIHHTVPTGKPAESKEKPGALLRCLGEPEVPGQDGEARVNHGAGHSRRCTPLGICLSGLTCVSQRDATSGKERQKELCYRKAPVLIQGYPKEKLFSWCPLLAPPLASPSGGWERGSLQIQPSAVSCLRLLQ